MKVNPYSGIQKMKNSYLNRFTRYPFRKKVLNTAGAILTGLGAYIGTGFYENSYYKLNKDGYINYVTPVQKNFETQNDAVDYAKRQIINGLKSHPPYEHLVYINNATNNILAEFKGDNSHVTGRLSLTDQIGVAYYGEGYSILHGHPENGNGLTNPLGFNDFYFLVTDEYNTEVSAVNKYGEVSKLKKLDNFRPLNEEQIEDVRTKIIDILKLSFYKTRPGLYDSIIDSYTKSKNPVEKEILSHKFDSILTLQDTTIYCNMLLHAFWKKHAPKIGLEYFTNFSRNTPEK